MSYKDYSTEAVKEIMSKVKEYQENGIDSDSSELSLVYPGKVIRGAKPDANGIQEKNYEYNHPTTVETNWVNETHIFFEKWFESNLSEETIWKKVIAEFEHLLVAEKTSGKIKKSTSGNRWIHINHSNHETIVRLKKSDRFASLKVVQRVGFWGANVEGVLHGSYSSLILFGIIYGIFEPSLSLSIGILVLLWTLMAFIIYGFSVSSRTKRQKRLANFTNELIEQFKGQSEHTSLSNTGTI